MGETSRQLRDPESRFLPSRFQNDRFQNDIFCAMIFVAPQPEAAKALLESGPSGERRALRAAYGTGPTPPSPPRRVRYSAPTPSKHISGIGAGSKRAIALSAHSAELVIARDLDDEKPFQLQRADLQPIVTSMESTMDAFVYDSGGGKCTGASTRTRIHVAIRSHRL